MLGFIILSSSLATDEDIIDSTSSYISSPGKALMPLTSNKKPRSHARAPKLEELIRVHVMDFLKKNSGFLTTDFGLWDFMDSPSFSQFTTISLFPYHFLKSPPLL